jgi:hypothetical protein
MALTKLLPIASMDSGGGATAERIYKTAWLWDCNSGSSLSSDMRKISGLMKYMGLLDESGTIQITQYIQDRKHIWEH